jgi:hypothetical protein
MRAAAEDLDLSSCIFAALAAIRFVDWHRALARRMGAFVLLSIRHDD